MKVTLWSIAILLGVALLALTFLRDRHPDTSSVPSYESYSRIVYDSAPSWSRDGSQILFYRATIEGATNSVWITTVGRGDAREFLADAGLPAWSPDGKSVAFSSGRGAKWYDLRNLLGGKPIHLWVADASGQNLHQVTRAQENDLDAAWSPDGKQIAFTAFPGPRIMIIASSGGEARRFVDGFSPAWSPDGKRIAYYSCDSTKLGTPCRIVVASVTGKETKTLHTIAIALGTFGRPTLDWSADGERLLSMRTEDGCRIPVVVNIDADRVERTFPVPGSVSYPRWSPNGERIAYSFTDTAHPARIETLTITTGERSQLASAPPHTGAQLVRFKSDGNLEIPSWLYVPTKAAAKRPAIVWLHGGTPGNGSMPNQFENAIQYFADNGFVVLALNYRGSIGFGDELANGYKGLDPLPDVIAAVNYLRTVDAVDPSRIALVGFSFGGFLTLRTITQESNLVAAAVDFFGPSDWVAYYRNIRPARPLLISALGGSPEQKPDVYRALSPINFVDRMKVPLLVLYGTRDPGYDEGVALRKALQREHKEFEYITYRFAGHGFQGAADVDAMHQTMRFLSTHLRASK